MKVKQDDTIVDLPFTQIKDVLFGKFSIQLNLNIGVSKNDPINVGMTKVDISLSMGMKRPCNTRKSDSEYNTRCMI